MRTDAQSVPEAAEWDAGCQHPHSGCELTSCGEVINQWEDWVWKDPRTDTDISNVYDPSEIEAMWQFQAAWDVVLVAVPEDYPSLSDVQALPEWEQLRVRAEAALAVFMKRGRLSEDHEVAW